MGKFIDMTGWVMSEHGVPESRLTVVERAKDYIDPKRHKPYVMWSCRCSCGNDKICCVSSYDLRSGHILSCGCVHKERTSAAKRKTLEWHIEDNEYAWCYASNSQDIIYVSIEDYYRVKDLCWCISNDNGVKRINATDPVTKKHIRMHVYLGYRGYDHINKNELDNRRENLRKCTHQQNDFNRDLYKNNTSGFTGVIWVKQIQKWQAAIMLNRKTIYLGVFNNKEDAIKARLQAENKYFGEFAPQRRLFSQYGISEDINE